MLDGKATELAGVKVVDDATVDIAFNKADVLFPIYPVRIFDTDVLKQGADWFLKVSAGTGPFQFAEWKRGEAVRLKAFPGYWGGAPKIDEVVFQVVPNIETALSLYETKGLDLVEVPPQLAIGATQVGCVGLELGGALPCLSEKFSRILRRHSEAVPSPGRSRLPTELGSKIGRAHV